MLETSLDTTGSHIGRQDILLHFCACRSKEDEPLKAYFTRLSHYHTQLNNIDNAITDCNFCTQIFTSLPSQYVMILMVLKHRRPLPKAEEAMHNLLEEEISTGFTKELRNASLWAALPTQHGGYHGQG